MSQQEFLTSYYYLSDQGLIHAPIVTPPPPPPLLSANVKISFTDTNIAGFSSSIPIDDIGQLQGIMNDNYKNKAKYALIGTSTNQPISTLSELINNINDLLATAEPDNGEDEPDNGEDEPDITITDNMITQQVINFNIINGRAVGSIKFVATNNFNPYYYNKEIINLVQFKTPNGVTLLVKENRLRFTQTERDEIMSYNENIQENTRITVESHVWAPEPSNKPFSKMYSLEISEAEEPKPVSSGILGAGVAGAIGILILAGFIADSRHIK